MVCRILMFMCSVGVLSIQNNGPKPLTHSPKSRYSTYIWGPGNGFGMDFRFSGVGLLKSWLFSLAESDGCWYWAQGLRLLVYLDPRVCRVTACWAMFNGFGPLVYMLLGSGKIYGVDFRVLGPLLHRAPLRKRPHPTHGPLIGDCRD